MIDKGLMMPFERKANLFQKIKNIPKLMGDFIFYVHFFSKCLIL